MIETPITIRTATAADNHLLAEFGRQTFYESFVEDNNPEDMAAYLAAAFAPAIQAAELADPVITFMIAEINCATAGYTKLRENAPHPAVSASKPLELVRIYAGKEWIGRGVGGALMAACLEFAAQKESDAIWLSAWQRNPRALAFYRKWGFQVVGTQIFQVGSDPQTDYVMARRL